MSTLNHPNVTDVQWTESMPIFHSTLISTDQSQPIEKTNSIDSGYIESNSFDTNSESSMKKNKNLRKFSVEKRQCNVCKRILASRQALITHNLVHRGERPFICDYELCEYKSTTKQNLELHRNRKHINPTVACKLCARKIRNIEEHMRKMHPEKSDILSFGNQMNEPHVDNSIKLSICDKTFISSKMLKVDERKHWIVGPIVCEICDLECESGVTKNEHKIKMHVFNEEN